MSLIKWSGKPDPVVPSKISEAMRNAEPRKSATERVFSALEKALTEFEHRKGVLEREIAERQAELADLDVAVAATNAGLSGLNEKREPRLTLTVGDLT